MKAYSLVEVLLAFHHTFHVESPIQDRLGIMLNAPPGNFKSTCIMTVYDAFPDALVLGDINAQTLNALQPELARNKYRTLAFPDFEKLYERAQSTASNAEGIIKAMMAQGYSEASFDDHRLLGISRARVGIVGGLVPIILKRHMSDWIDNGFARRFLWCSFEFDDPRILIDAIHEWKSINFDNLFSVSLPLKKQIQVDMTIEESKKLEYYVRRQYDVGMSLLTMKRIYTILKWKFKGEKDKQRPMEIIQDFAGSLGKERAKLTL